MEKEQNSKTEENINIKTKSTKETENNKKENKKELKEKEVELSPEDKVKKLEEKIPGFLFKTLISKPESSAKQVIFVFFEKYLALIIELSLKDVPFSFGLLSFRSFSEQIFKLFGSKSFISLNFPRLLVPTIKLIIFFLFI